MSYDPATTVPQYWSYDTNGSEVNNEVVNVINAYILAETNQTNQTKIPAVLPRVWNVIMYAGEVLVLAERLTLTVIRRVSDNLSLSESFKKKVVKQASETLSLAEVKTLRIIRKLSDSISIVEKQLFAGRPPGVRLKVTRPKTDTLGLAETSIARIRGYFRAISETLTLTETTRQLRTTRRRSETLVLAEGATVKRGVTRIVSDTLSLAESIFSIRIPYVPPGVTLKVTRKITTEILSLVDSIFSLKLRPGVTLKVTRKITPETLHLVESIVRIKRMVRTISDNLILSDGAGFTAGFEGFFTGLATGFEEFAGGVTVKITRSIRTEFLGLAEGLGAYTSAFTTAYEQTGAVILKVIRNIGPEVLSLAEAISIIFTKGIPPGVYLKVIRPRIEALILTESISRRAIRKVAADTLTLAETAVLGIRRVPRTVSETLTLSETTPIRRKIARLISPEALHLTEFLDVIKNPTGILHSRFVADTLTIAEAAIKVKTSRPLTEILNLVESIAKTRIVTRTASDFLHLTETAKQLAAIRQITTETLTLTETAISRTARYFRTIPETLNLAESLFKFAGKVRVAFDTLQLTEAPATVIRIVPRFISESLGLAEAAVALKTFRNIITETLSLSESLLVYLNDVLIYSSAVLKEDVYKVIALFNKNIRRVRDLFFGQPGNTG